MTKGQIEFLKKEAEKEKQPKTKGTIWMEKKRARVMRKDKRMEEAKCLKLKNFLCLMQFQIFEGQELLRPVSIDIGEIIGITGADETTSIIMLKGGEKITVKESYLKIMYALVDYELDDHAEDTLNKINKFKFYEDKRSLRT